MSGNKLWWNMTEEEWQKERKRIQNFQEKHTKGAKREEVE